MSKLIIEKTKDFDFALDSYNRYRKATKEEINKIFEKKFDGLEEIVDNLHKVGLYLADKHEIEKPKTIPFAISEWPIIYSINSAHPYGKYLIGYVKSD